MTTVSIPHTDVAGEPFPAARFIKEIGRGKNGARSMTRDDACALYRAMLDGRVSDLELGGILLSMRIKGESVDEIAGFLDAAEASFARRRRPARRKPRPVAGGRRRPRPAVRTGQARKPGVCR